MTTWTIYAASSDHTVRCQDATYANARAGTGTLTNNIAGTNDLMAGQNLIAGNYRCEQTFMEFNTSAAAGYSLTSVILSFYVNSAIANVNLEAREKTLAGGTGDFVAGANLASLTAFGTVTAGVSTGYANCTGPTTIVPSATYGLILYGEKQRTNVAPTTGSETVFISSSDVAGTSYDPYLTIVGSIPIIFSNRQDYLAYTRI